jgi:hypothetical protein
MQRNRFPSISAGHPLRSEPTRDNSRMLGYPEVIHFIRSSGCPETRLLCSARGLLAEILPPFPRRLQLPIALGKNLLQMPAEHVPRSDVSDGTV